MCIISEALSYMVSLLLFVALKVRLDCIKFENCCLTLTPCTLWNQPVMHSPDTFLNILSNLIFLNALRSTHNAFAIDAMGTSGLVQHKKCYTNITAGKFLIKGKMAN